MQKQEDGIFINNKQVKFESFESDSKIFDIDMSISKYSDDLIKDKWLVVRDGLVSSLFFKVENGIPKFVRVISSGDSNVNRMFKDDSPIAKRWMLDKEVKADFFEYLPIVFVLKNGKSTKKGGIRKVHMTDSKNASEGIPTANMSIFESKDDEEKALANVCPVCFMEKANGHCFCDFD